MKVDVEKVLKAIETVKPKLADIKNQKIEKEKSIDLNKSKESSKSITYYYNFNRQNDDIY